MGPAMLNFIDGMFSFVLYDAKNDIYFVARDHVGITTLYQGWRTCDNTVWFASEMKALNQDCDRIISFPPGTYYTSKTKEFVEYYNPKWYSDSKNQLPSPNDELLRLDAESEEKMYADIRKSLEKAVKLRLMSDVPYGVLLSGGLDSSLIAAICMRARKSEIAEDDDDMRSAISSTVSWPKLHSFSVGLPGSPDLAAAKKVSEFLGTAHHAFTFTVQEGLDAIYDVIYHLETYDVTTVRASTPMYLLSRKIKAMGVKMVLSGEGSDEIFGGILNFDKL
jgi:asparagine synthase (glutamine-hydrolysing)